MQGKLLGCRGGHTTGFSLVETLVVLAILSVLTTLLVTSLTKAVRMAKATAAGESMHQQEIGRRVDPPQSTEDLRPHARRVFRQTLDYGKGETLVSELLFVVQSDEEFLAYWHTLLNPRNTAPLQVTDEGALHARKPNGEVVVLPPVGSDNASGYPVAWEFISTDLSETARGDLGGTVVYRGGGTRYVRYPRAFPMTPGVARLSHRFMELMEF